MLNEKILGALCLLTFAAWSAYDFHCRTHAEMKRATAWITLLSYVRGQIACFNHPLDRILARADSALLGAAGIDAEAKTPFVLQCRTAADEFGGNIGKILTDLAGEIVTLTREDLLIRFDTAIADLEKAVVDANAQAKERDRLNATLRLCGAIGIILLLW